ncbi:MAG: class II glutamine amidotransferase [Myxococcales bacterium]|nr:class II glutamine amidotransferase [Myxococcales bacterium]
MCRLFGFRSVIQSQVHQSLVEAENALAVQSRKHPDGWGVAYYVADAPHLVKGGFPAVEDHIFRRVSGLVASQTVLAHIRKATVGDVNTLNSHPFQHGSWVFAHNGQVEEYGQVKEELERQIAPTLRRYVLGDTDSEVIFYLFLTQLSRLTDMHRRGTQSETVALALARTVRQVREIADHRPGVERSKLTLLVTDGHTMVGLRSGTTLMFSTYKGRCSDRGFCPFLSPECEAPTETGFVNHLLISSEQLQGQNVWIELEDDHLVGVDWRMRLFRGSVDGVIEEAGA